jgi:hypothetical protein
MKVTTSGNEIKVDMSFDEWVATGASKGWITTASDSSSKMVKTASLKSGYSSKIENMLKTASSGDIHDVASLPHMILLNSGSETPNFAEKLTEAISKNKSLPKPRIVQLDVSKAASRDPASLKKSIASVVTAANTVWKVVGSAVPSIDVMKAFTDNAGPMHKSNTWVVFEVQD